MVDFYCVFDGCFIRASSSDLFESIKNDILPFYPLLSSKFKLDKQSAKALHILAKNSRKRYSINKQLGHFAASFTMNKLLERGFLQIEKSKEEKIKRKKGQKLKKALRKYTIQDKVLFRNNFLRFFAYFLQPNENLILNKAYDELLAKIKKEFKHYQSLCFEGLGRELLESKFKINSISSFWSNDVEIDLFYKDVCLDDGLMEVLLCKARTKKEFVKSFLKLFLGRKANNLISLKAHDIKIKLIDKPAKKWCIDGEKYDYDGDTYCIKSHGRMKVLAPKRASNKLFKAN